MATSPSFIRTADFYSQLSIELTTLAHSVGAHEADAAFCQEITDDSQTLEQIGEADLFKTAERLQELTKDQAQFDSIKLKVKTGAFFEDYDPSNPDYAARFKDLQKQIDVIHVPLTGAFVFGNAIVEKLFDRMENLFQMTLHELSAYRRTRREWVTFITANSRLKKWISIIIDEKGSFLEKSQWPLNDLQAQKRRELLKQSHDLDCLANPCETRNFLRIVDALIDSNQSAAESIQSHLCKWPQEYQLLLDQTLYQLSSNPQKQEGKWIQDHRFDDLKQFREAYLRMVREYWKKKNEFLSHSSFQEAFCVLLHQHAFGPKEASPIFWCESELPYLIPLLPTIDQIFNIPLELLTFEERKLETTGTSQV